MSPSSETPCSQRSTAAEIAAGITPVNYSYPPGDVRRYMEEKWENWFAWYPVRGPSGPWIWWKRVERSRRYWFPGFYLQPVCSYWVYRVTARRSASESATRKGLS